MRRLRREREKGSALVEFAVSAILILTVLFGIIDAGRALYAYDWVANAARKGTRFMEVRGTSCTNNPHLLSGGCPANSADARNYITNANGNGVDTTGIDTSQVSVSSLCYVTRTVGSLPPCAPTTWVEVTVNYQFKFITPFLTYIAPWQMHSSSEVIVQN
jgi:Flp pilus assembly protein TadG